MNDDQQTGAAIASIVGSAGLAIGIYHGYHRNRGHIGWTLVWGVFGAIMPVVAIPLALAQGLKQPKD